MFKKLYNKSSTKTITNQLFIASSFIEKSLGLIGKPKNHSLYLNTRWGIHTFFLKHTIDIIILDPNNKITKIRTLTPDKLFFYNPKYSKIIELPENSINIHKLKIGHELIVKNPKS